MSSPERGGHAPGEPADVSARLAEAVETLRAIRAGEVDALVVADGSPGEQVFTLSSADRPYRMFVENMRDGAATVSEAGVVLYANRRLSELLAQPLSRIIGAPLTSLVVAGDHAMIAAHNHGAGTGEPIEIELIGPDHLPLPVRVGAWTLNVDFERVVCLTFADLTEVKREQEHLTRASEKAVEASRLKSDFVANMSHEIRTPLNGVIGMIGLLLETGLTAEQREYADAVRVSGDALLSVIDEILDFSKIEAGKLELEEAPFTLLATVEEVCSIVAAPAHANGVELLSFIDESVPTTVTGDCTRVRQVLTNLMANAVKFTAAGEVCIEVTQDQAQDNSRIRFEITDTGIGIGAGAVDRVFESFVQADGSTTRRYGGTGLGLAISKHLVGLMGGQIGLESVEGRGSTFWFTLPLRAAAVERSPEPVRAALVGARVLAVDDNAMSRRFLARQLLAWGVTCDTAAGGDEALRLLRAPGRPYDMVLLDAGMPGMSETDLVGAIRSLSPARPVPVLMLVSSHDERQAGREAGADGFLTKPASQARLEDGMARVLNLDHPPGRRALAAPDEPFDDGHEHDGSLVLLAEDNEINRLVAVRMLEKRGFRVDVAVNGREALRMCRRRRYRAIFMDCQMPEVDGYQATAELRRREGADRRVPIIAMTASTMKGDREKCLAAGMDDYLPKPIDGQKLTDAIARSLDSDHGRARNGGEAFGETCDATPPQDGRAPLLDRSMLDGLCEGDAQMRKNLVNLFADQAQGCATNIARAIHVNDPRALELDAHRLKGSAASVGALRMADLCDRLSQAGREGLLSDAPRLLRELERASKLTSAAL